MRIERIASLDDERLTDYTRLTDVALRRRLEPQNGLYLAESPKVIARALEAGHTPRSVLVQERWLESLEPLLAGHPDTTVFVGDDVQLERLTGFVMHRGALAAMHRPALPDAADLVADADLVVILEDIVDHTNVGAVFRSVAGLGADAVLVTPRCADPLYRRSVRVSMGTVLQVPWTRLESWPTGVDCLRERGFSLAALTPDADAVDLRTYARSRPDKLAVILGTEGDGVSRAAARCADDLVSIPMAHHVDSLNVAAAGAVALYALRPATHE